MDRPNIILLTIDTLRADMMGVAGHSPSITPNLDKLAQRGLYFEQAITGGSWTQAAFRVLLTSTYASMYGGCMGTLAPERPSPVQTLAQNGYHTAGFSTNPWLSRNYGFDKGYDYFADLQPGETNPSLSRIKGGQRLLKQPFIHRLGGLLGKQTRPARLYEPASVLNKAVIKWLESTDNPFFVWAHYMDVHWPYHLEGTLTEPEEIAQAWFDVDHLHQVNFQNGTMTEEQRQYYIGLYKKALQYTDEQIGKLLNYVETSRHGDNTIIIVVSDHGEEFLERKNWGHVEINLHDEILHVPLIMMLPHGPHGRTISQQTRLLDIMPTVLDLCGCSGSEKMLGSSMRPLWEENGEVYDGRLAISERWRRDAHIVSIRTGDHKYIWNKDKPDNPQLYDLHADPQETNNIASQNLDLVTEFHREVQIHLGLVAKTVPSDGPSEVILDESVIKRLRGLGYID